MKCFVCGVEFDPPKKTSKYCSAECHHKGLRRAKQKRVCKQCGRLFVVGRDSLGIFCSRHCSAKYYGEIRTQTAQTKREQQQRDKLNKKLISKLKKVIEHKQHEIDLTSECVECGSIFQAERIGVKCCSDKCRKKYDNRRRDKRIYQNGKPDLSISLTKLYMRDMGVCQLCGRVIDFDVDSNSDDYPSIDHIIPLSKGGLHEWNNVQLACRGCNRKKSNDTPPYAEI